MKPRPELRDSLVEQLTTHAASWSGFNRDAIQLDAIRRAARDCLAGHMTSRELLQRAAAGDPLIVDVFRQAVCVGETYFFRSPEHFAFLMDRVLVPAVAEGAQSLRAWSAACSTGEEAYSLAACLRAAAPRSSGIQLEVLGTDLSADSIRRARLGHYRAWSVRETAPIPVPIFDRLGGGGIRVDDEVRAITTFATHDLLDPAPPEFGEFNVIFCRNVLVYFDADAIRLATKHLAASLMPRGIIVFGVLEVDEPPEGLVRVGPPSLTAFERPLRAAGRTSILRPKAPMSARPFARRPTKRPSLKLEPRSSAQPKRRASLAPAASGRPKRRASLAPAVKPLASDIKARHLDALHLIERDQRREALNVLSQIQRRAPAYVAALLDQALLYQKAGHKKLAAELMRQILELTAGFPLETILPGLEELPVSYYRAAVEAFLKSASRQR